MLQSWLLAACMPSKSLLQPEIGSCEGSTGVLGNRSGLGMLQCRDGQSHVLGIMPVLAAQCLGPTYTGDFHLRGAELRKRGLNRVGNLLVPNSNYCAFEDWIMPILDAMKREQDEQGACWTPSKVCAGVARALH